MIQLEAGRQLPDGGLRYEPGCAVTAPFNPHSHFAQGFYVMFGEPSNPAVDASTRTGIGRWRDYPWEIGKVGLTPARWMETVGSPLATAPRDMPLPSVSRMFPGAEYPDPGATVECWTVGRGKVANLNYEHSDIYLMEAEVLSPFYTFLPARRAPSRSNGAPAAARDG